jgi:hypothetical protein
LQTFTGKAPYACYIWGVPVLVIDDDVELCSLLAEFLRREGFDT